MDERVERLLKDFVALTPDEMPNFTTKGGITFHPEGQKDRLIFVQGLTRKIMGVPGKERTEIIVRLYLLPNREMAHEGAISLTTSQLIYPDGAGMPQGSWTGLPIGEKSWATAPDPKEPPAPGIGTAVLVVWDDRLTLEVIVNYQPIGGPKAKTAIFLPIAEEDLEAGELAARIILAKATLVLIGWEQLPSLRLVVNGTSLRAKGSQGSLFVPVGLVMKALGCEGERKGGIWIGHWRGKKVTFPIGARCIFVGDWTAEALRRGRSGVKRIKEVEGKAGLKIPVLYDGRQVWVEGEGLAKALGLKLERKGQTIALLPK